MTEPVRFWSRVDKTNTCWLWTGSQTADGYGRFGSVKGRYFSAHKFAYEQFIGPVPKGLELDHLCRVRHCVNPDHLEAVTHAENVRRSPVTGENHRSKTHCPQNHEYTEENTGRSEGNRRYCRACKRERSRISMRKLRATA